MSFKINAYNPSSSAYAPRIKHKDWEKYRSVITQLHVAKTPRKVMLKRLKDNFDFTPTLGQLQAKCKEWNLKVYTKDSICEEPYSVIGHASSATKQPVFRPRSPTAFYLATESGLVEEWSDDFRVHTTGPSGSFGLPAEYIAGGLLANTADSHWPVPVSYEQCERMLQAAHYYRALNAYQQSFSIYRAVYLYQRRHLSPCDEKLLTTILLNASSAVTDHQRNIMHSVLTEIGSATKIVNSEPIVLDCLQAASLDMIASDVTCETERGDVSKARAALYHHVTNRMNDKNLSDVSTVTDAQGLLYIFEHDLLMQEHETKIIQNLLVWCDSAIERLHHELDDIFVGATSCADEYHRRVSQVLSGHLLSMWHRRPKDCDDQRIHLMPSFNNNPCSFHFRLTTTQTLVALAFCIIDAVHCDPLLTPFNKHADESSKMWFLDAAKLFKRGIRMICRLDERSRCAVFAEAFLERVYSPIAYRRKIYPWTAQLPAIVDAIGISLAQEDTWVSTNLTQDAALLAPCSQTEEDVVTEDVIYADLENVITDYRPERAQEHHNTLIPPIIHSRSSECDSIASFINTYHRTLKQKFDIDGTSGRSTPGDVISLASSADFKFGLVASGNVSADVDSFWHCIASNASELT